jgi:aspartyl protease family protein
MKAFTKDQSTSSIKIIFLIISFISLSINILSQDLNVNQTLAYLNNKFKEFPLIGSQYSFYNNLSITSNGELNIETLEYAKSFDGTAMFIAKFVYKIAFDKIDATKSFEEFTYGEKDDELSIFPILGGSYYEELKYGDDPSKIKTIPSISASNYRNSITIFFGDGGNKDRYKNAFLHLYSLVISDPVKYGLNSESDPFATPVATKKTGIALDSPSNTIKIVKTESGLIEVPVVLNDVLRINFIFDSGASEVSISPDVALTLIRAGTITESDFLQDQVYTFADGSKAKSKRFLLKKLMVGNQTLTNIEASISKSIDAPMLIGQNVMNKLGSVTIDYDNQLLIIRTK